MMILDQTSSVYLSFNQTSRAGARRNFLAGAILENFNQTIGANELIFACFCALMLQGNEKALKEFLDRFRENILRERKGRRGQSDGGNGPYSLNLILSCKY